MPMITSVYDEARNGKFVYFSSFLFRTDERFYFRLFLSVFFHAFGSIQIHLKMSVFHEVCVLAIGLERRDLPLLSE